MKKNLFGIMLAVMCLAPCVWADNVPNQITINEIYTNKDGTIPSTATTKNLRVSLYKKDATTSFWDADFDKVALQAGGEFWVVLNKSNSLADLPSFTEPIWYEVTDRDDSHKAVTKKAFTSAPYAKHADDGVPQGAIIIWILTAANPTIPAYVLQQYEVVQDFPGCFPRLGSITEAYGTGGSETHSHSFSAQSGNCNNTKEVVTAFAGGLKGYTDDVAAKNHSHSVGGTTADASTIPPYVDIVFLRKK